MKKSFYWSLALIAGLVFAGIYSTNVFAEDALPQEPEASAPIAEEVPAPVDTVDTDGDAISDEDDNCPADINEDQADADEDGEGDACDEQSSDEGEVEGAVFSALRGGHDDDDNGHINICHILGNGGYNQISVSKSGNLNGHDNHGADIIPPFEKSGPDYPGKNWTTEGQAIWNNGCQPLPETGSITIVKVIADGSNQDSEFTFTPNWKENFSLGGGDSNVSSELEEGVYTIIETVPDGWNYPTVECTDQSAADDGEATINLDEGEDVTCTFTNSEEEVPPPTTTTIHAQKIVCDEESDLPNWGAGSSDITSTTASDWLAANDESGCHLADWNFQWGYATQTSDPDDGLEDAGTGWTTFSGSALIDVANENNIRVRESADADYIGFTGQNTDQDISAEVYCGSDVLHYDNWEWMDGVVAGQDYYCVAWNVPVEEEQACRVEVVSDETNIVQETLENAIATYNGHPSWTASIPGATWIWKTLHVENPLADETFTFKKTFIVEDVNDATLWVAADNSYEVRINGDLVNADTNENNFQLGTQENNINVLSFVDENTTNEITVKVKNWALTGGTWESNPAGALYRLVINAEEKDLCEQPPVDTTSDVTICKYENSLEGNLLSDWDVWLDHWAQDDFKATIVIDGHDYEGTTEENGCVTIADVPYGSYRLDEIMKEGWVNVSGAGTQVVVDDSEETFNLVNAHECNPELNLIENSGFETPIVVANGGAWEQFVNGTPLLEWVADLVNTTTDAPLEIQSGYSGWVGHDGSEQYAELDSTAPTTISQDVPTTPGNTYRLTYWRAARPGTEPTNNANRALVDGVEVDSNVFASVGGNPDWYPSPVIEFTAANTLTNIAFKDDGSSADSYGTFIDDVALYCVPPVVEHHNHVTICKAEVGHDGYLSGWTVGLNKYQAPQPEVELVAIDDEREYEGVTGEGGCVTFTDVDLAEYYVEEDMQDGWEFFSGPVGPQNIDSDQGDYHFYITNQQTQGGDDDDTTITVNKVINVESNQEFNFFLDGSESAFATLNGGETSGPVEVTPGSHSVGEGLVEGWNLTDITCLNEAQEEVGSIDGSMYLTLEDGDDIICTFTNTFQNGGNDETPNDTPNDNNGRSGSNRHRSFSGGGEVLGASTENNFCPFLRDYQHINTENDPSEVNKAKAFFNSYLGMTLPLDGTFDTSMFNAVVQFQNMFKPDVLDTWTEEFPGVLDDNATGYLYQTTKWKINSIICPGYETFPDQLIMAPGTTVR